MTETICVGLSSWIIEDGNYGEFSTGDRVAFALEFWPLTSLRSLEPGPARSRSMRRIEGANYEISAQITLVRDTWTVIDTGVLVYELPRAPAERHAEGSWVTGTIFLGIDPFSYFERLAEEKDAPALIYDWSIEKIEVQAEAGRWQEVEEAWGDHKEYLLHCRRLPGPPRTER